MEFPYIKFIDENGDGTRACRPKTGSPALKPRYDLSGTTVECWRSWPNRRPSHGSHSSEIRSEGGPALGNQGRSVPIREAETQEIIITRHGKPAGVLIGFESEEDWFDYRLERDPRFLQRIEQARNSLRAGGGIRLEDVETE